VSALKLDAYLPYRLSVAANAVSDLIARAYQARFGLSIPQWRLVAVLGEDGLATPQALCARTLMDKVTVSRSAAGLVERDLVERAPNPADGRSHSLSLTAAGRALYEAVAPAALDYERRLLGAFTEDEAKAAHALLRRLQATALELGERSFER
jgi:DNA-binding MarR family transcriptional regulator